MCMQAGNGDVQCIQAVSEEKIQCVNGGCGRSLLLEVAQHHDAEVVLVAALDMGTLQGDGSGFPDIAHGINDIVVADVSPALADMRSADGFDAADDLAL